MVCGGIKTIRHLVKLFNFLKIPKFSCQSQTSPFLLFDVAHSAFGMLIVNNPELKLQ